MKLTESNLEDFCRFDDNVRSLGLSFLYHFGNSRDNGIIGDGTYTLRERLLIPWDDDMDDYIEDHDLDIGIGELHLDTKIIKIKIVRTITQETIDRIKKKDVKEEVMDMLKDLGADGDVSSADVFFADILISMPFDRFIHQYNKLLQIHDEMWSKSKKTERVI